MSASQIETNPAFEPIRWHNWVIQLANKGNEVTVEGVAVCSLYAAAPIFRPAELRIGLDQQQGEV